MGYYTRYSIANASELFAVSGDHVQEPLSYMEREEIEATIAKLEKMGVPVPEELRLKIKPFEANSIVERILQNECAAYALGTHLEGEESTKWYDHEEDLREISKEFPGVLIELHGEGEDAGDIWRKYFRDGKVQVCEARIVFDEFDESKLV